MRQRLEWPPAETVPSRAAVLALQGVPAEGKVPERIDALLDDAMAVYLDLARPRAVVASLSRYEFARIYQGDGRNAPETPLAAIYPKADRLALLAATVGEEMSRAISDLFRRREPAVGCMIDAVASAAADRLGELVGARYLSTAAMPPGLDCRVLAYSPGYCGWHVSGQRALFDALRPQDIGVTLNASCLMQPLKSISGVLVVGPKRIHRIRPTYPFCEQCADKPCRARLTTVTGRDSRHANRSRS